MNKCFAIYTVMVGGYDNILQPLEIDNRFDYILFTNDCKDSNIGVWQVRSIPVPDGIMANDNKRISRYPKMHPTKLLGEYEASLYIDANIQITDKWVYERFLELHENKSIVWSGVKHPERHCIYEEAFTMSNWRFENDDNAFRICHYLRKNKYPKDLGLYENNIIYRKHCPLVAEIGNQWWYFLLNYSCRDQLSLYYVLWKNEIPISYFLPQDECAMNTRYFNFIMHNDVSNRKLVKVKRLEKLRIKVRKLFPKTSLRQWYRLSILPYPHMTLTVWGILSTIICTPVILYKIFQHRVLHIPG